MALAYLDTVWHKILVGALICNYVFKGKDIGVFFDSAETLNIGFFSGTVAETFKRRLFLSDSCRDFKRRLSLWDSCRDFRHRLFLWDLGELFQAVCAVITSLELYTLYQCRLIELHRHSSVRRE